MKHPIVGKLRADEANGEGFVDLSKEFETLMADDPITFCDVVSDIIWELSCLRQTALEDIIINYKKHRNAA